MYTKAEKSDFLIYEFQVKELKAVTMCNQHDSPGLFIFKVRGGQEYHIHIAKRFVFFLVLDSVGNGLNLSVYFFSCLYIYLRFMSQRCNKVVREYLHKLGRIPLVDSCPH